eukprot:TCONS_00027546-protein
MSDDEDQPPHLPSDLHYEKWRQAIDEWRRNTSIDLKRQALVVRTKLTGRAREIALKIDADRLNQAHGMHYLMKALDEKCRSKRRTSRFEEVEREEEEQRRYERERQEREIREKEEQLRQLREEREREFREWEQERGINDRFYDDVRDRADQRDYDDRYDSERDRNYGDNERSDYDQENGGYGGTHGQYDNYYGDANRNDYHDDRDRRDYDGDNRGYEGDGQKYMDNRTHDPWRQPEANDPQTPKQPEVPDMRKPKQMKPQSYHSQKLQQERLKEAKKKEQVQKMIEESKGSNLIMIRPGEELLTPAERARKRAAELSDKLVNPKTAPKPITIRLPTALTPRQPPPPSLIQPHEATRVDSQALLQIAEKMKTEQALSKLPQVMKKDTGTYFTFFEINDFASRPYLIKKSTHDLLKHKTGCTVSIRGRYYSNEGQRQQAILSSVL